MAHKSISNLLLCLGFLVSICAPNLSLATSWDEAITAVETKSEDLWELAEKRGLESRSLGTALNELHAIEHRCAILGRMLGKVESVLKLEQETEVDVTYADADTTAIAARSLGNWVYQARRIQKMSKDMRIESWNLDCVGKMGIPNTAFISRENSTTFYTIEDNILHVLGDINNGFAKRLLAILEQNPEVDTVALGSGGGAVYEAILAGILIRERNLDTTLWNNCYSACTIVFAGGSNRRVWSPYSELSYHQVSIDGTAVSMQAQVYTDIARYIAAMGGQPQTFIRLMLQATPDQFYTPKPQDLCELGIATWVQRLCMK